jgi:hypothetical protein
MMVQDGCGQRRSLLAPLSADRRQRGIVRTGALRGKRCSHPSARLIVALAAVLAALPLPGCGWPGSAATRPDIILVVVDSLRADYLGCYGFEGDVSPALMDWSSRSSTTTRLPRPGPSPP